MKKTNYDVILAISIYALVTILYISLGYPFNQVKIVTATVSIFALYQLAKLLFFYATNQKEKIEKKGWDFLIALAILVFATILFMKIGESFG